MRSKRLIRQILPLLPFFVCSLPSFQAHASGFAIESEDGNSALKITGRLQTRLTYESLLNAEQPELGIYIPRARLKLSGHTFNKNIQYMYEMDWGKGGVRLKDYYIDLTFSQQARLRVGQYKIPYSRQQLTSSGKQELVERAITDKAFTTGRDIGVMLHNGLAKVDGLEWGVGLFNGNGPNTVTEGLLHPMFAARVGYNSADVSGYSEIDFTGGGLRFGVAANSIVDLDMDNNDDGFIQIGGDWIVKQSGFATTGGVSVSTVQDGATFAEQAAGDLGIHLQASYLVKDFAPAIRVAQVRAIQDAQSVKNELTAGIGYFAQKHKLKCQLDGSLLDTEAGDTHTQVLGARLQLQLAF